MKNGKYVIAKREEAPSQVVEPIEAPKNEIQEVKVEAEQTKEPVKEVAVAEIENAYIGENRLSSVNKAENIISISGEVPNYHQTTFATHCNGL